MFELKAPKIKMEPTRQAMNEVKKDDDTVSCL
jgi:hypothetical protein